MSVVIKRERIKSGRPIIRGTKLTVPHVATLAHDHDISPEDIVEMYSGVDDVKMVYEALAYYEAHLDEMERLKEEREEAVGRLIS